MQEEAVQNVEEMIDGIIEELNAVIKEVEEIGHVQSVKIQTFLSVLNATDVMPLAAVVVNQVAETAEAETAEVETAEAETAEVETVEVETVEAETVEAETVEVEIVEVETVEVEPAAAETVEAETVEAAQAGALVVQIGVAKVVHNEEVVGSSMLGNLVRILDITTVKRTQRTHSMMTNARFVHGY